MNLSRDFSQLSKWASQATGKPATFALAFSVIIIWACMGPFVGFSDSWQLVINTSTTIITFLMVFLIQNSQTRDTMAVQIKLDEIIRALEGAHNVLLDLEELDSNELESFQRTYQKLAGQARKNLKLGKSDTGVEATQNCIKDAQEAVKQKKSLDR